MFERIGRWAALGMLGLAFLLVPATLTHAAEPPTLYLPTPRGETWEVIQGYNCGTHDGWGRLSFDIVNHDPAGRTAGAPVYAAADGSILFWGPTSGTLILSHGDGYYTMYTHMQSHIAEPLGTWVARGTQVGTVGAVSPTPTEPHLHFTFFRGQGVYVTNRVPLALEFADAGSFPDHGGCNEYAGTLLTATGELADTADPTITWTGSAAETWTSAGRIDWTISDDGALAGFSQAWDTAPDVDSSPQFADRDSGFVELTAPGQHTLFVRAWDRAGHSTLASYAAWLDPDAPILPAVNPQVQPAAVAAEADFTLEWAAASDALSGVSGYQLYFGPDSAGTSEWFVSAPQVGMAGQPTGTYVLRVRAQDSAGNFSAWTTVETVVVQ